MSTGLPGSLQAPLLETGEVELDEQLRSLHEVRRLCTASPFLNGAALGNPNDQGVFQGYSFVAGEVKTLAHGLGRPFVGVLPILTPGPLLSNGDAIFRIVDNPAGVSTDQSFTVRSGNTCTVFFYVF